MDDADALLSSARRASPASPCPPCKASPRAALPWPDEIGFGAALLARCRWPAAAGAPRSRDAAGPPYSPPPGKPSPASPGPSGQAPPRVALRWPDELGFGAGAGHGMESTTTHHCINRPRRRSVALFDQSTLLMKRVCAIGSTFLDSERGQFSEIFYKSDQGSGLQQPTQSNRERSSAKRSCLFHPRLVRK